jgi:bacteriorhodopsin
LSQAFFYSGAAALSSHLKGRARIAYTACCIHLLACLSYFLMSQNLVPLVALPNSSRFYVPTRIFEWSATVPMLITLIGKRPGEFFAWV